MDMTAAAAAPQARRGQSAGNATGAQMMAATVATPSATQPTPLPADQLAAKEKEAHAMIVASTFANLELQSTRKTLQETLVKYQAAVEENKALAAELRERDRDALQVVEFLRVQLEERNARVVALEHKIATAGKDSAEELERERQRAQREISVREAATAKCEEEVARLRKELDAVALFKRERQEVLLEITRTKERQAEMVNKYEKELTKLRFQTLEEKVRLRAAEKEMADKFNEEVDNRAMILVDVKARGIHDDNKRLAVEKAALQQEVDQLITTERGMRDELVRTRREVELGLQTQEVYAQHGAAISRNAKQANGRVRQLEDTLGATIAKYDAEMGALQQRHAQELAKARAEADEAKNAAKMCRHELARMRTLTQSVINQRSDLENFFNDALAYVREQQQQQHLGIQQAAATTTGGEATFPSQIPSLTDRDTRRGSSSSAVGRGPLPLLKPSSALIPTFASAGTSQRGSAPSSARAGRYIGTLASGNAIYQAGARASADSTAPSSARGIPPRSAVDTAVLSDASARASSDRNPHRFFAASADQPHAGNGAGGALVPTPTPGNEDDDGPDFAAPPSTDLYRGRRGAPSSTNGEMSNTGGGGVQFSSLSWSDKEKIISALLFKMNKTFYANSRRADAQRRSADVGSDVGSAGEWVAQPGASCNDAVDVDPPVQHMHTAASELPRSRLAASANTGGVRDALFPRPPSGATAFMTSLGDANSATGSRPGTRGAPIAVGRLGSANAPLSAVGTSKNGYPPKPTSAASKLGHHPTAGDDEHASVPVPDPAI